MKQLIDFSQMVTVFDKVREKIVENKAAVAAKRYEMETSGITIDGLKVSTDRDSQSLVTGAAMSAMLDNTYVCKWKTAEGFVELDADKLLNMAKCLRKYVQACFDREAVLIEVVESETFSDEMLNEGWPDGIFDNA
jgi:hypothetical protein